LTTLAPISIDFPFCYFGGGSVLAAHCLLGSGLSVSKKKLFATAPYFHSKPISPHPYQNYY